MFVWLTYTYTCIFICVHINTWKYHQTCNRNYRPMLSWCSRLKDTHVLYWSVSAAYPNAHRYLILKRNVLSYSSGDSRAWCQHVLNSGEDLTAYGVTMVGPCAEETTGKDREQETCWRTTHSHGSWYTPGDRHWSPSGWPPMTLYCIHFSKAPWPTTHTGAFWNLWVKT